MYVYDCVPSNITELYLYTNILYYKKGVYSYILYYIIYKYILDMSMHFSQLKSMKNQITAAQDGLR
jgi:hypothetical protein